jgi:hypothetical protein
MKNRSWHFAVALIMAFPSMGTAQSPFSLATASTSQPHLRGKPKNANYLSVTAGDRLYAIADQAGRFPAIGFHIPGEMGGIWQHPIKLLDGFRLTLTDRKTGVARQLDKSGGFITYSFTTQFLYSIPQQRLSLRRTQFVPDGIPVLSVEYAIENKDTVDKEFAVQLAADVNLMPVWLGERAGMTDSTDIFLSFDQKTGTAYFKDNRNPWYVGVAVEGLPADFVGTQQSPYKGKGITGVLSTVIEVARGKTALVRFHVSGSDRNIAEIDANIGRVRTRLPQLFRSKQQRYLHLARNASIDIPDKGVMEAYEWGKYTSDWLVRDVPGLGRSMSAGLPDYPWFFNNDHAATFDALLGTVEPDIFFSAWNMHKQVSQKANGDIGRIVHEFSTNGAVYDNGRMEESQLHVIAAWNIFRWTGDIAFLRQNYAHGQKTWTWLQQHDTNQNGYIEGYGGVEIQGLNAEMLDVQVATQVFLEVMGHMAMTLDDTTAARMYQQKAAQLRQSINRDWWVPRESRFADFISTKEKAISIIDTALAKRVQPGRNVWAREKLTTLRASILDGTYGNDAYVVYYNAGLGPLEEGVADSSKAVEALRRVGFFTNKFGLYISGIERPDDIRADEGSFQHDSTFNYNRAIMPIATANLIIAECRYGSADTALLYMHKLLNSFSFASPGTTYEVSPDYGMFVQGWNIRGIHTPLIHYFFGIDPLAYRKEITLRPNFPTAWAHASIADVIVGDNLLSMTYRRSSSGAEYTVKTSMPNWTERLYVGTHRRVLLNGKIAMPRNGYVILEGTQNRVQLVR